MQQHTQIKDFGKLGFQRNVKPKPHFVLCKVLSGQSGNGWHLPFLHGLLAPHYLHFAAFCWLRYCRELNACAKAQWFNNFYRCQWLLSRADDCSSKEEFSNCKLADFQWTSLLLWKLFWSLCSIPNNFSKQVWRRLSVDPKTNPWIKMRVPWLTKEVRRCYWNQKRAFLGMGHTRFVKDIIVFKILRASSWLTILETQTISLTDILQFYKLPTLRSPLPGKRLNTIFWKSLIASHFQSETKRNLVPLFMTSPTKTSNPKLSNLF